ncbi:germ line transcription factor 1 [Andrena cerasifolii]|uniref:germ line transcription factor 1 n=1 Tax=Andrena cerasifolii TaxID=2819439 RepID=UPI0040381CDC
MSKDIRSYFATIKTNSNAAPAKATKRRVISSDEDNAKSQSPFKRNKKTKTVRKNRSILSDSDEDANEKKIVSPTAVFGNKPVRRQEAPKILKSLQKEESNVHKNDDFEATLSQLDNEISKIERKYLTEIKSDKDSFSTKHEKHDLHKTSTENDATKKILDKNKDGVKEEKTPEKSSVERNDRKHELTKKKHSHDVSSEDVEHRDSECDSTPKHVKKPRVTPLKIEIHKESKKKGSPKKTEAQDVFEERIEKKKQHIAMYQQYLHRGGARNPGSKEIPVGADYCLAGLSFVITGVLDSLEREDAEELIKKYGGRVLHQVTKKTNYVIMGDQSGPAKISKANSLNIKTIVENDLLEMIRTRPMGKACDVQQSHARSGDRTKKKSTVWKDRSLSPPKKGTHTVDQEIKSPLKARSAEKKDGDEDTERESRRSSHKIEHHDQDMTKTTKPLTPIKKDQSETMELTKTKEKITDTEEAQVTGQVPIQALVEKYRPKTLKQILGQQGDKSNAKKLYGWLMNWHRNQSGQVKHAKPSPWAKNDDGGFFKAALLSGAPGIGKTTTVQVVCDELGFDLVEFNASDTRSKKLLQAEVSELLSNMSLKDYFTDNKSKPTSNHVLLMDEVDGMAGNEDRGGLQELIGLIKSTDIPIVCICNDRNNPKMRTLSNYTFDLRFQKPRLEQIRGAMKTVCFKENINIPTEDLDRLIESTNHDIRQVINHLALFVGKTGSQGKSEKQHVNKDLKLGPWDVVRKVFSAEEHKHMSIHDKSDLFFHDYNIASLFVQENYLMVIPQAPKSKLLEKVAETAESLALGDTVEKSIRSNGAWSLLPMQACYSSVIPGAVMSGHVGGQINFPAWLGRNSKTGKFNRLMQEITVHTRLATGVSKEAINLDYIKPLRDAIVRPLAVDGSEGVDAAVNVMNHYHLLREDLDSLTEISLWPGDRDPMQVVDSKVKAAFTRAYNKNSAAVPYTMGGTSKKKSSQNVENEGLLEEEEGEVNSDENDDNVDTDKMIKAKKPAASKKTDSKVKSRDKTEAKGRSSSDKPSKRGKGRGRGK